jgi:predicted ester cyclase
MTREAISSIFERRRAAYAAQDAATLAGDYTDDSVIESPSGGIHHGPVAAERVFRAIFDALDARVHHESLLIDGDAVAQFVHFEGTDGGQFLGMPPTGKSFRVPCVILYKLHDGKIMHERRIYDFTGMLVQLGLLKTKPV